MTTHRYPLLGANIKPDAGVFWDVVNNQVTFTNEAGNQGCFVIAEGAVDIGIQGSFDVPQNYVGSGKFVAKGILDGAMSSNTLGVGVQGLSVSDNESADQAFSSADLANDTTDRADKDLVEISITLSNLSGIAAGDELFWYWFLDISVNDYAGNFLLTGLYFEYSDA